MNSNRPASHRHRLGARPICVLGFLILTGCSKRQAQQKATGTSGRPDASAETHTYTTKFLQTESPISEGGRWINGGTTGLDWGNVQTASGRAFGTNVSKAPPFDDSTAVLAGDWGPNQMAEATVYSVNQTRQIAEEVELRLRTKIAPHSITGYEFDYRVTADGSQYISIVRWDGKRDRFTYLTKNPCTACGPGLHNGDTIAASAIGNTLTLYINSIQYLQATDGTYVDGSPGIGFWNWGGKVADDGDYGFSSFTAFGF